MSNLRKRPDWLEGRAQRKPAEGLGKRWVCLKAGDNIIKADKGNTFVRPFIGSPRTEAFACSLSSAAPQAPGRGGVRQGHGAQPERRPREADRPHRAKLWVLLNRGHRISGPWSFCLGLMKTRLGREMRHQEPGGSLPLAFQCIPPPPHVILPNVSPRNAFLRRQGPRFHGQQGRCCPSKTCPRI